MFRPGTQGEALLPTPALSLWNKIRASAVSCYYGFKDFPERRVDLEVRKSLLCWLYAVI